MASIREKYNKEVIKEMKKKFNLSNDFEVPKIKKVVVNVGIGKFLKDSAQVEEISKAISTITGQKPLLTKSKKSIAGFKIREGLEVGMKVTLRGKRMWDFIEKLVKATIPRVKDFHGLKNSAFDSRGNLNIGIKEHIIFPEILPEEVKNIFSLEVTVVTDAKDKNKGLELFKLLGFPMEIKQ
ncbi:MAG: 50S ribosomal protein L5 [Candidatus Moranbacteria bacterium CG23_combo_of_CG06-09_8_20_14_all_35_22]|nr:MAG: 50S ribosomal protein L5 [Candidatus Moranbacteria bacterium CG23_combo_of_CG06-09_8_20_14_all_35_22]